MKHLLLSLSLSLVGFIGWSQCETSLVASDTLICPGDSVTLVASGPSTSLTSTFAAGNNHRGNMFDVTAINTITIQSFDGHPMANTDYEIYYKVGTFAGNEANAGAWTLVGSATNVIAQPQGTPTPLPIPVGIVIPAGQTYAFYITSSNVAVGQNYTNGTSQGALFSSDANLQFFEGIGLEYPFTGGGGTFSPRVWNGTIHYSTGTTTTFSWSTGATTASIVEAPTSATTYYVDITTSGCPTVTDSVSVNMNPVPVVDLGADTTSCPGTQVNLDAGAGFASYDWNSGTFTTQTINATAGASYDVTVTNAFGCEGTDTIFVAAAPDPIIDFGPDSVICENAPVLLDAGNPGSTYSWNTGDSTQTILAGGGTFIVTVTDANNCTAADTVVFIENAAPTIDLSADTTICVYHTTTLDAGAGYDTYLWSTSDVTQTTLIDGSVLGVGSHDITIEVTNSFGCSDIDTVQVIVDDCLGVEEVSSSLLKVYPNPTEGILNLEFSDYTGTAELNVYTMDGLLITSAVSTGASHAIDFTELASGAYVVVVNTSSFTERIRVVRF